MNALQLRQALRDYPVTVCAADQLRVRTDHFVIANTDTKEGPGLHWVTFYFPRDGPDELFDSLGQTPFSYDVGFERALQRPYLMLTDAIQDPYSDLCGLYCIYYVMERFKRRSFRTLVTPFDISDRQQNDRYVYMYWNNHK